jgi:predicted transcriptional regulator
MTKEQLEAIFDRVRSWPAEKQQEAVEVLLWLDGRQDNVYVLSPEERADIEVGLVELERGEIATEEEVAATFARFRK